MLLKKPLLLLFLLFYCLKGFSATFVVTGNADIGPGTLRDALTQAAANGQSNTINFNLPGNTVDARTITLLSSLPQITSSIIIDGTSQPGKPFGVTDARIRVINDFSYAPGQLIGLFYAVNCGDVEIYGMWISAAINIGYQASIFAAHCDKVIIGAPLKGNLIENTGPTIDTIKTCYFQHNICFTDTTGEKPGAGDMIFSGCDNLTVGGSPQAGNMIAGALNIFFSNPAGNTLDLSYNKLGTDFTGTQAPYGFNLIDETRVSIQGPYVNQVSVMANIKNNIIADVYDYNLLYVSDLLGKITIQGNAFNTDFTGTLNFNTYSQSAPEYAIAIGGYADVLIGGDDPSQKNLIAYAGEGIGYSTEGKCTITKNSIFCVGEVSFIGYVGADKLPQVNINAITATSISGTSTPGSKIELFNADCSCYIPTPKDYFATVQADANGKWTYTGAGSGYIMASATLDSLTGYFKGAQVNDSSVVVKNFTCNANGSITGIINPYTTAKIFWYNSKNELVGTAIDLQNVPADTYTLQVDYGGTCDISKTYTIQDYSIHVDSSSVKLTQPSCGMANGSVSGLNIETNDPNNFKLNWTDAAGKNWGNNSNLQNIPAGTYKLSITNVDNTCNSTYGPVTLTNTTGPNIDQSHVKIQSTNCGQSMGSITNLVITGTTPLKYIWWNSQQQTVSTDSILTNQPAGTYKLEVTDGSQCGAVYTTDITIPEINGITIDETNAKTTSSSCGTGSGSVTGIQVTGATQYQWTDAGNNVVSKNINLTSVPAGTYILTATNTTGCSKTSQPYTVTALPPTVYPVYPYISNNTCPNSATGSIKVTTDTLVSGYRWVNSEGENIGTGVEIDNLAAGAYTLYLTDKNGCETLYYTYTIKNIAPLTIEAGNEDIAADQCDLKRGSITGIQVEGGIAPYTYSWADANGNVVSTTVNLENVGAGAYTLTVDDASGCGPATSSYTLQNTDSNVPAPSVSNVQVCSSGAVLLSVNDPSATAIYNLYNSETSTQPVEQVTGGKFKVTVTDNTSYFITQVSGTCESSKAQINISVGLSSLNIANTFTPNGDGVNDYWQINNIANYPQALVQIFTRYGQKIFESKSYSLPFDGTYKGQKLPPGVYYYIINLNTNCSLLSGSLTIIR
jgi:gliding motility-associated-like protein